ncbi:hypothetical protein BP5796_01686 [Coleophoma crateriformis]|uniref:Glucose-methanol-choline oxidoreductase N-terminal domain-containing protein n=1 Tax=Coleophoma crateriformis TaxID=565419 RepID=A0A3D8T143_9HELO|nr:hypothetical protein BP5796_01686 [Coleophoma crateriformis]
MRSSLSSLAAFAAGAVAQISSSYVDSNTGITFQGYQDSTTGFQFGMALPTTVGSDFIGQMVYKSNGTGYGGVTFTGTMTGSMMVVAWPSASTVVSSFRETTGYTNPAVLSNSSLSLSSIANGTFVNSTHVSYTFLCGGCVNNPYAFVSSATEATIGWAVGSDTVTDAASADSASFVYHDVGFGDFGLTLTSAQSASYATWAAMATVSTASNTTTSSNSTCSSSTTNTTATVSNSTYDYIIAGAGPAGIIVAERLVESGASVLLIERGQESTYATGGRSTVSWNSTMTQYDVPAMDYYLTSASDTSEYCTDTASMAGCILGGGTMVNAMMFVRPQDIDFDDKWPTGWKSADMNSSAAALYARNPGTTRASVDGKLYDQAAFTLLSSFFQTSLGFTEVDAIASPNSKTKVYSHPPSDALNGLRAGPVRTYLPLAQAKSNFEMSLNTKVIRAVRNGTTISGVEVETSSGARQIINLNSNGRVVLAAGAMSSPRILFNSGIGPTAQINTVKNGCTSVTLPAESQWINLPVGENLKDHPIFTLTFNITGTVNGTNTTSMLQAALTNPSTSNIELFAQGSGPLAQSDQRFNFWTNLETTNGTRYFQGTCNSPSEGTLRIKLYLTHGATSSGVLGITSSGATTFSTQPLMNTDADKSAVITMIDSILNAAKNSTILTPSDSTATGASLVSSYVSGDHFLGTAMMGTSNDGTAVVDTDTKVFGTDNLFVVDASIHPDLPTGNTQAIVMVAAEQAAKKILALGSTTTKVVGSTGVYYANTTQALTTGTKTACTKKSTTQALTTGTKTACTKKSTTSLAVGAASGAASGAQALAAAGTTSESLVASTVLVTDVFTVTSCAASITNCPAGSTAVSSSVRTMITSVPASLATDVAAAIPTGSAPASSASQIDAVSASSTVPASIVSTVLVTDVFTVTSCAASITNCPAGKVSSSIRTSTTLIANVASVTVAVSASSTPAATSDVQAVSASSTVPASIVSTVLVTDVFTVTSCAASITNCPAGKVTSSIRTSTTLIANVASIPVAVQPSGVAMPSGFIPSGIAMPSGFVPSGFARASGAQPSGIAMPSGFRPSGFGGRPSASNAEAVSAPSSSAQVTPAAALQVSTVLVTDVLTITSCASDVTNCPARTTSSIRTSTTLVANVASATPSASSDSSPASAEAAGSSSSVQLTTSVVQTTRVSTVYSTQTSAVTTSVSGTLTTSIATSSAVASVVTETIDLYTTICPVTAAEGSATSVAAVKASATSSAAAVQATAPTYSSGVGSNDTQLTTSVVQTTRVSTVYSTMTSAITTSVSGTLTTSTATSSAVASVVTETIDLYTTICPVTAAEGSATSVAAVQASSASSAAAVQATAPTYSSAANNAQLTTSVVQTTRVSTVYSTKTSAITTSVSGTLTTSIATSSAVASVVTETIDLYTTICPVTAAEGSATSVAAVQASATSSAAAVQATAPTYSSGVGSNDAQLTTSVVQTTRVSTVYSTQTSAVTTSVSGTLTTSIATSSAVASVVTETVDLYTTICPVTASQGSATASAQALGTGIQSAHLATGTGAASGIQTFATRTKTASSKPSAFGYGNGAPWYKNGTSSS